MSKNLAWKILFVAVLVLLAVAAAVPIIRHTRFRYPVVVGPGVTRVARLSDFGPGLKGTRADTNVYVLEGREPGGKALIIANTHPNEPAGLLAALIFLENAEVDKGTLYVIPNFNRSAGLDTKPGDGYPHFYRIPTPWGEKTFRYGSRDASPLDQWPDPDVFIHYPDRQLLSFIDARNTNRTWPGRPNGLLMERVTFAAMELLRNNQVDVAIDLHGAETMFPVTNCIVAPQSASRLATRVALFVKAREKFDSHVEPSPYGFRGLSHREIGDYSDTLPFLLEAPIPFLDQPTGPKTEKLLLDGRDPFLLKLSERGKLFVPYDETGWPIDKRVGQHVSVMLEIFAQYSRQTPERSLSLRGVPRYADIVKNGTGYYFHDPKKADASRVYEE
ncbi:MAG: succinylglutamate desuccinylase/aspartoacylase family protein [Candidatus Aminicenantes bacterium]|nr:succinylglutamate desuccinylase/aspartoacylase family protein [Candidatus Aminicenantes bacterium]